MASKSLEERLEELGNTLASPPDSAGELYSLLDLADDLLSRVEQSPSQSMLAGLKPLMNSLVAKELLTHSDTDVRVAVASCISEITRITAPEAPYEDDIMKVIFQMIVGAFEGLSDISSRTFNKRVSVLETVAKVRSCVVMLDLECDALILEMFHHFLNTIRLTHSENVYSSMETIMTLVIEESEEISSELLSSLLTVVKTDNKDVLPIAQKLVEQVMSDSADKLKPYLLEFVESSGAALSDYSKIVASICQENLDALENNKTNTLGESVAEDSKLSERTVSDEMLQVSVQQEQKVGCPGEVGILAGNSAKVALSNGSVQVGNSDAIEQPASPEQKLERSCHNGPSKETVAASVAAGGNVDSVTLTNDMPDLNVKHVGGRKSSSSAQLTDNSDLSRVDNDKETPAVSSRIEGHGKETEPPSGDDDLSVKEDVLAVPEKTNELQHHSVIENRTQDIASQNPSESAPESTRSKRGQSSAQLADTSENSRLDNDKETLAVSSRSEEAEPSEVDDLPAKEEVLAGCLDPEKTNELQRHSGLENTSSDDASKNPSESLPESPQSKRGRPSRRKTTKRNVGNAVAEKHANSSVPKDSLGNSQNQVEVDLLAKEEVSAGSMDPEKMNELQHHPVLENTPPDGASKNPSQCLTDSSRSKRGRPSRRKTTKRSVADPVAEKRAYSSAQKDSVGNIQTQDEVDLLAKEEVSAGSLDPEKTNEHHHHSALENTCPDDVSKETSVSLPESLQKKKGRPSRRKAVKHNVGESVADKPASSSHKDSLGKSQTQDEVVPSKDDEKESDGIRRSEGKSERRSGKKIQLMVAAIDGETAVDEEAATLPSDTEVKLQRHSGKKGFKRKAVEQEFSGKKHKSNLKQQKGEVSLGGDKPGKPNLKIPETSDSTEEQGDDIVGLRIAVWWPDDERYYDGVIDSFDSITKKHKVVYIDGDVEELLMKNETWKTVKDTIKLDAGKEKDIEETDASQMTRTKVGRGTSNSLSKHPKTALAKSGAESSDKSGKKPRGRPRGGATNLDNLEDSPMISKNLKGKAVVGDKAKTPTSSGKLKAEPGKESEDATPRGKIDKDDASSKSRSAPSRSGRKSKASEFSRKLKDETPKPSSKSDEVNSKSDSQSSDEKQGKQQGSRMKKRNKPESLTPNGESSKEKAEGQRKESTGKAQGTSTGRKKRRTRN